MSLKSRGADGELVKDLDRRSGPKKSRASLEPARMDLLLDRRSLVRGRGSINSCSPEISESAHSDDSEQGNDDDG